VEPKRPHRAASRQEHFIDLCGLFEFAGRSPQKKAMKWPSRHNPSHQRNSAEKRSTYGDGNKKFQPSNLSASVITDRRVHG
jgi:hypothetical protein